MNLHGKSIVAGRPVVGSGEVFKATNPATGEPLAVQFHKASDADVEAALGAAQAAFTEARRLPAERFAALLERIAGEILALGQDLVARGIAETGLPEARLTGERARTMNQLKMFAALIREGSWVDAVIDTADPNRQPLPKPDVRRMLRPIGPVVVFGAGNFPFAFGACGGDTASALAAGNPVVVKAHTGHPGTNELFTHAVVAALKACELPAGLFSLLQGPGSVVGQALVKHPATQAVGFTGSRRAGRILFDLAAARPVPIPVYAEMGSLNPLVILPGALAERSEKIAAGLAQSITLGVGQFCTKPGLIFLVESSAATKFIEQLARQLSAIPAAPMLDAGIHRSFCEATAGFASVTGVRRVLANEPGGFANAAPQLFETDSATWQRETALHEEAFGPAAIVIRCRDLADLQATVRIAGGNLTATIHAGAADGAEAVRVLAESLEQQAGRVIFDSFPTGVEVCHAMVHGGPHPATSAPLTTSVGTLAIHRFARPVCFQNVPDQFLPLELRIRNERKIWRLVNGQLTKDDV